MIYVNIYIYIYVYIYIYEYVYLQIYMPITTILGPLSTPHPPSLRRSLMLSLYQDRRSEHTCTAKTISNFPYLFEPYATCKAVECREIKNVPSVNTESHKLILNMTSAVALLNMQGGRMSLNKECAICKHEIS